jgi:hypothetical protein
LIYEEVAKYAIRIWAVVFLMFLGYTLITTEAPEHTKELEQVRSKLDFPGANQVYHDVLEKQTFTIVKAGYTTERSYYDVRAFYYDLARNNGWIFVKEEEYKGQLRSDQRQIVFQKNEDQLTIIYDLTKSKGLTYYLIILDWDEKRRKDN